MVVVVGKGLITLWQCNNMAVDKQKPIYQNVYRSIKITSEPKPVLCVAGLRSSACRHQIASYVRVAAQ